MATTIQNMIDIARFELQDQQAGSYRYTDEALTMGLSLAFDEAYRIRPDIFVQLEEPTIIGQPLTTEVPIPRGYKMAFAFYMCGFVSMSDQEDTQDSRATVFLNKFVSQMTTTAS